MNSSRFPLDAQSGVTSASQPTPSGCVEVFKSATVVTVHLQDALKTLSGLYWWFEVIINRNINVPPAMWLSGGH